MEVYYLSLFLFLVAAALDKAKKSAEKRKAEEVVKFNKEAKKLKEVHEAKMKDIDDDVNKIADELEKEKARLKSLVDSFGS